MKSAAKHSVLVTLGLLGGLFVLLGLVGCDGFLVSICNFGDRPSCPGVGTDGVMKPGSDMISQNPDKLPPANGAERSFAWMKTMPLDSGRKFVGMYDRDKVLILANNPFHWEAASLEQDGVACMSCPDIPTFISTKDSIYITNDSFYFFQYGNGNKLWRLVKGNKIPIEIASISIAETMSRPFVHPSKEALMFSSQESSKPITPSITTLIGQSDKYITNEEEKNSVFLIGDLDSNDAFKTGSEIATFTSKGLIDLKHQNGWSTDQELLISLQKNLEETKVGDSKQIQAAFIDSFNDDEFPDLIYVRNGEFYITSYKGRNWFGSFPIFESWKKPVLNISGETVRSIAAVELTKDRYTDLVIETNVAVHLYKNIPKAGF